MNKIKKARKFARVYEFDEMEDAMKFAKELARFGMGPKMSMRIENDITRIVVEYFATDSEDAMIEEYM